MKIGWELMNWELSDQRKNNFHFRQFPTVGQIIDGISYVYHHFFQTLSSVILIAVLFF